MQKLSFRQFQYLAGDFSELKREAVFTSKGQQIKSDVGYVLRLARDNLYNHLQSCKRVWLIEFDRLLDQNTIGNLIQITQDADQYRIVNRIIKNKTLKVVFPTESEENQQGADSDDPDLYNDFELYNDKPASQLNRGKKSGVKPIKKLV